MMMMGSFRRILEWLKTILFSIASHLRIAKTVVAPKQVLKSSTTTKFPEMPQIMGLPVVGTLFDLMAAGGATQLHKYIDARHRQLGPIFRERLGGTEELVFVSSANLMRSVFLHEGQYPRHPLPEAWKLYNKQHAPQRGLFFMEGSEWLHNRRILNRLLLNGNLNWMGAHVESITRHLVAKWRSQTVDNPEDWHEVQNLEDQLYRWSIEVVCGVMFGSCALGCNQIQSALDHFAAIVQKVFEFSSKLMNFPPKLAQMLRLGMWRNFEESVGRVLQQADEIIELFIAQESKMPLSAESEALFHKLQTLQLPKQLIKRIFVDLVIAAGDTTAFSSQWALYLLSQEQSLQRRIAEELAVGTDAPLLHGLIRESLRLYPVAPFMGRYLPQDTALGGYLIKKNTMVVLSLYTAGRDEAHFEQPLQMLPERWGSQYKSAVRHAHGTLPFGIGQRSCIGRRIALKQLHTLLGACASEFEIKCLNETPLKSILRMVTVPDQKLCLALKLRI